MLLVRRLGYVNVHPYYIYMHDLVKGVEDLRTTLQTGLDIEKGIRGATAGFNTPTVVVDAPGGGGKRDAHSYEHYDRGTGISVFTAPAVHADEVYFYFDPLHLCPRKDAPAGLTRPSSSAWWRRLRRPRWPPRIKEGGALVVHGLWPKRRVRDAQAVDVCRARRNARPSLPDPLLERARR